MDDESINIFLNQHDYDIRKTNNGRWIDQKCTMDVICMVADCILEYIVQNNASTFTVKDIWLNEYTVNNVQQIFCKPDPSTKATNEYDKYFGQPIKLFDASGILKGIKVKNRYIYSVENKELLEYISFRERNALNFLCLYIEKVLNDSGIYNFFKDFFDCQNKNNFKELKDAFTSFTIKYTKINGSTECGRIFTKVLNPIAYKYKKKGTERGHISDNVITQDQLLYNQRNWRDVLSNKPKEITRMDYDANLEEASEYKMTSYRIARAKKNLRKFNDLYRAGKTEVYDKNHIDDVATQMHHIFPANEFPSIADFLENLIALTPTQHFSYAHPNNNTLYIDKNYQYLCLVAKTGTIRENILGNNQPLIYDFHSFQTVLSTGLNNQKFYLVSINDFDSILNKIEECYT